jgi:hypothetical protein
LVVGIGVLGFVGKNSKDHLLRRVGVRHHLYRASPPQHHHRSNNTHQITTTSTHHQVKRGREKHDVELGAGDDGQTDAGKSQRCRSCLRKRGSRGRVSGEDVRVKELTVEVEQGGRHAAAQRR